MTRDEQIAVMERMGGVWQKIAADLRRVAAIESQLSRGTPAYIAGLEDRISALERESAERLLLLKASLDHVDRLTGENARLRAALERIQREANENHARLTARVVAENVDYGTTTAYDVGAWVFTARLAREALEPPVEGVPGLEGSE